MGIASVGEGGVHVGSMVGEGLVLVALPIAAVALVRRITGAGAGPIVAGGVAFVGSQLVHLPLNGSVLLLARAGKLPPVPPEVTRWLLPVLLGLSAGLCEETARWLSLRGCRTRARAAATGVGHGGTEAAILGVLVLVTGLRFAAAKDAPLPPEAQAQMQAMLAASDWTVVAAIVERVLAMTAHLGLSMLVGLAVVRRSPWPWVGALLFHAAMDAGAVALVPLGAVATEGFVALCALAAVAATVLVARAWPAEASAPAVAPPAPASALRERPLDARDASSDAVE